MMSRNATTTLMERPAASRSDAVISAIVSFGQVPRHQHGVPADAGVSLRETDPRLPIKKARW